MIMTGATRIELTTDESSATVEEIVDATPDTGKVTVPELTFAEGQAGRFSIIA